MQVKTQNKKPLAYHEAGHAFITVLLGGKFNYVTINPIQLNTGGLFDGGVVASELDYRFGCGIDIANLWGGMLAEAKYRRRKLEWVLDRSGRRDSDDLVDAAQFSHDRISPDISTKEILIGWLSETRENINSGWSSVTAIANALLDKETLTYDEVKEIVNRYAPEG